MSTNNPFEDHLPDVKKMIKGSEFETFNQPTDCCHECGKKYGRVPTRVIGMWNGTCSICGATNVACAAAGHDYLIWEMPKEVQ